MTYIPTNGLKHAAACHSMLQRSKFCWGLLVLDLDLAQPPPPPLMMMALMTAIRIDGLRGQILVLMSATFVFFECTFLKQDGTGPRLLKSKSSFALQDLNCGTHGATVTKPSKCQSWKRVPGFGKTFCPHQL